MLKVKKTLGTKQRTKHDEKKTIDQINVMIKPYSILQDDTVLHIKAAFVFAHSHPLWMLNLQPKAKKICWGPVERERVKEREDQRRKSAFRREVERGRRARRSWRAAVECCSLENFCTCNKLLPHWLTLQHSSCLGDKTHTYSHTYASSDDLRSETPYPLIGTHT